MRFFIGDTETTGVGTEAGVCEIAWMEVTPDLSAFINPVRGLTDPGHAIPAGASAVHGITDKDVAECSDLITFMAEHGTDLMEENAVLIAHNAAFDYRFFQPFMPQAAGTICTLKLARLAYPDADNHKLQTLKFYLGLEADVAHHEAHTALADVKVLGELVRCLQRDMGWSLDEMFALANQPQMVAKMPFGKHRGKALKDIPKSYVKWLLGLENLDDDLRWSLEQL